MNHSRSALRYAMTYWTLLQHFALDRGFRFWIVLAVALANAFIHPIPFLLIAEILRSTQAKAGLVALGWRSLSISVQPDFGVLFVFLIGAGSFLMSYGVSRLVGREIVAWQGKMFWQLMSQSGRMARWDRTLELGAMLQPLAVAARLDVALRGAFPIGRLIETGSRDFIMILALGSVLAWQDPHDTAVLALISLLFIPAYAMALSRLVRMQSKSNAQLSRLLQPVAGILSSEVTRRPGQRLDTAAVPASVTEGLSKGFGSQSYLLNEQNAVTVVAGIHMFAAFYGVYLAEGQSLASLPATKLTSLFFLVLLLRSLMSLVGLVSRLSRGYERLGQLRALLYPAHKSPLPGPQQSGRFRFANPADRPSPAKQPSLGPGDCIVFLAPDTAFNFQLLPLSNALTSEFVPGLETVRHIPLLGADDVAALVSGSIVATLRQQLKLPLVGAVPLQPDPVDLGQAPVVALNLAAWQRLVETGGLALARQTHLLVLVAPGRKIPVLAPPEAWVVLSDGRKLIEAGDMTAMTLTLQSPAVPVAVRPLSDDDEEDPLGDG